MRTLLITLLTALSIATIISIGSASACDVQLYRPNSCYLKLPDGREVNNTTNGDVQRYLEIERREQLRAIAAKKALEDARQSVDGAGSAKANAKKGF